MMLLIWQSLYLLAPAYLANMSATLASKLKILPQPLDHNKKIITNYFLGPGKTYGGTLTAMLLALAAVALQSWLFNFDFFRRLSVIDYAQTNWLILGILSGLGAVGGDIVASFFKRRLHLPSGTMAPFLDQWDFIIGYFLLISLTVSLSRPIIMAALVLTLILHPLSNLAAYWLKLKKVWW
ncbi:MAG TPA: hypothetical protein DEB69_03620 [Candidatus Komeilibacteria bacterium]|nr:MAG: hypothetical protein UW98_C0015G0013 [Parcubacteria group bacterium GW2011_GWC2_45_15]HBV02477.1 hypothetical protein [Candidatus Komeilibacteria bacterium]